MTRKSFFFSFAAPIVLLAGTATYAADLPRRPPAPAPIVMAPIYNWTGCYVGGNIGAAWGRSEVTSVNTGAGVSWTNSGFIGGGQIGCDYQFSGGFVIGARDMLNGTSLSSGATFNGGLANGYTANSDISWVNTLTARVGYTVMPNALLYLQGGWAWTRANAYVNDPFGAQVAQFAGNRNGWTIGGGFEYLIVPHWSAFLEYNYMNFGTASGTAVVNAVAYPVNAKVDAQNILLGVNYRF